jgi:glutamate dehydrogenase
MEATKDDRRQQLIKSLATIAKTKLTKVQQGQFNNFIAQAMHFYPDADYLDRTSENIFWNIWGLFCFTQKPFDKQQPNNAKVRIFTPSVEVDGWLGQLTTIYIDQRDMPFLVDTLRMALNRRGLNIFTLQSNPVWIVRKDSGEIEQISSKFLQGAQSEALMTIEVDLLSEAEMQEVHRELEIVLDDVSVVVDGYGVMLKRVEDLIAELKQNAPNVGQLEESLAFLEWIYSGYFVFTGCAEFVLDDQNNNMVLREVPGSAFGLLGKYQGDIRQESVDQLSDGVKALYEDDQILAVTKSSKRSPVHRNSYSDYIVVKRFDKTGKAVGEIRFLGLYTSQFYSYSPRRIPILREKVNWIMQNSGLNINSHDGKALQTILDSHPRDELLLVDQNILAKTTIGIWQIYERRVVKVFIHTDPFNKFVSCLVYLPREAFSTEIREKLEEKIGQELGALESEFSTQFVPDSVLVRIHFVFKIDNQGYLSVTDESLQSLVERITRDWADEFLEQAQLAYGPTEGSALSRRFHSAFSEAYKELFTPTVALEHIALFDQLDGDDELAIDLFSSQDTTDQYLHLMLFHRKTPLELSDMIPMLENLGFRVLMEHPYALHPEANDVLWVQDFSLQFSLDVNVDVSAVQNSFKDALLRVWRGDAENDTFNRLVVGARLDWRSVAMLRLYARYLKQLSVPYSQAFIADTLAKHLDVTRNIVALFKSYFDPRYASEGGSERAEGLVLKIHSGLDSINNISEDKVIRGYLELVQATLRTNFFQTFENGTFKSYISVKLASQTISLAPKPRPAYEIFVYSPRVEGVHLRGGKVARGGLRWSDRVEDYRTEVLGLVKAQQVKNAVIVPTGAKGGFVAKQANISLGREAFLQEGIASYMLYIQALLDISDNMTGDILVPPKEVVRRDGDDPYLVVAADKGTATFSDTANEISEANDFWLGDAFASGGGNGYDHKGMGITARGAWVAVQRHFYEIGVDIQSEDFTVIGVGDMGGDVFGNGMLLSEHIQLVAAFNHLHIFVDPNPHAKTTFTERQRLFDTPRSTWDDFDKTLMSPGAAVYSRAEKSLTLTAQIKQRFSIEQDQLTPTELINYLLKAQVDLIWNGGIGTYVKASSENNTEVGDRANDALRVNGRELQCRVFGEGGNLGMTQRGRVEFCLRGGLCNTDFIDNAAGVDCSDHEVNIKILLNKQVAAGSITVEERNSLLAEMTDDVAGLVLANNIRQTMSISLAMARSKQHHSEYQRFLTWLEANEQIDRDLEFLPNDDQLADRINRGQPSWTRPELSVLICYSKVVLKESLVTSDFLADPWLARSVTNYFPEVLVAKYPDAVKTHSLANEIAINELVNDLVNRVGFSFFFRQMESTGASPADVIKAYVVVTQVLGIDVLWQQIEGHQPALPSATVIELLHILVRLTRRATRWFLRNHRLDLNCESLIAEYLEPTAVLLKALPDLQKEQWRILWADERDDLLGLGVQVDLAERLAATDSMFMSMGVVRTAATMNMPIQTVGAIYFELGEFLSLDWFMSQIVALQPENRWQDLARESYVDDLESQRRKLTASLCSLSQDDLAAISTWETTQHELISRWKLMIRDLRKVPQSDFAMISVALRELLNLVDGSVEYK